MSAVLGFDTSNYTTSAALYDPTRSLLISVRRLLPVPQGKQGLAQNEAVFAHVKQLPDLLEELFREYDGEIGAAAASATPRDVPGSYMPCFLVGLLAARTAAAPGKLPFFTFSHQAGHVAAALFSADRLDLMDRPFLAFHLSGGTTEGLLVRPDDERILRCDLECGSSDLKAGQAVDRVGAMLGLPFPAGPALDALSLQSDKRYDVKPSAAGDTVSLSGIENRCRAMVERGESPADVARFALDSLTAALLYLTERMRRKHGPLPLVFAGGVMSNTLLRRALREAYPDAVFAESGLSSDNAVGVAVLGDALRRKGCRS